MLDSLAKWYPEDDPIMKDQLQTLFELLQGLKLTEAAFEGFLIVCSRFVDEYGGHRTIELAKIFRTERVEGRRALVRSLEYMYKWVGGMSEYLRRYPVTIRPPRPAFPQFKIVGIETIASRVYRVLDSRSTMQTAKESLKNYIQRKKRLPPVPKQTRPVRRTKARYHWCSYDVFDNPETTRQALQILPDWSDCRLRATIDTSSVKGSAYVAFNGDRFDPANNKLRFYKYYYEPLAQDHPPQDGGGTQIALEGAPPVINLEEWNDDNRLWDTIDLGYK